MGACCRLRNVSIKRGCRFFLHIKNTLGHADTCLAPSTVCLALATCASCACSASNLAGCAQITNALGHVESCLQYMSLLSQPNIFKFCAIPQASLLGDNLGWPCAEKASVCCCAGLQHDSACRRCLEGGRVVVLAAPNALLDLDTALPAC